MDQLAVPDEQTRLGIRQHQALGTPVSAATLTRIRATLNAAIRSRADRSPAGAGGWAVR